MPYIAQLPCVAVLLLMGMAGCLTADQSRMGREVAGNGRANVPADRTVPGSLDRVYEMTNAALSELNIIYFAVRDGGIRFECRTANNARFCLVLVDTTVKGHDPQTARSRWLGARPATRRRLERPGRGRNSQPDRCQGG